jgi:hypothetical protein
MRSLSVRGVTGVRQTGEAELEGNSMGEHWDETSALTFIVGIHHCPCAT